MARVIILDANVIISFLDSTDTHHHRTLDLLDSHWRGGFGCSVLTVAEALVHPSRAGQQDAAAAALSVIGVRIISIADADALELARIRSQYRVRMPDAVALHAAITTSSALATYDQKLAAAADIAGVTLVG